MIQLYKYWLDQSISILMQVGIGYTKFKIHNWKLPKVTFYKTTKWVLSYNNLIELQQVMKSWVTTAGVFSSGSQFLKFFQYISHGWAIIWAVFNGGCYHWVYLGPLPLDLLDHLL